MFKIVSRAALSALLLSGFSAAHAQGYPPGAYPPGPYADPRGAYLGKPYGYPGFPDDDEDLPPPPRYGRTLMPPAGPAFADPADDDYVYGAPTGRAPSTREADLSIANGETTKQVVADPTGQPAGTLIVDTRSKHLYLTLGGGQAYAYGIGVGREGFAWKGTARVGRKAAWPTWTPPSSMLLRRPDLPRQMAGGPDNPLGARALYLYQGNKDTLFRIHGTNEPDTIGKAVSSGCIRMMNADVIDLFQRVPVGARVVVI